MATTTHIPLREYLRTSYRPDREHVDGDLRERNAGKFEHARIHAPLTIRFGNHERERGIIVITEQRIQVARAAFAFLARL